MLYIQPLYCLTLPAALSMVQTWVHMAAAPGTEAVSLAAVNSVGKAGGFLGPLSFGLILHATGTVYCWAHCFCCGLYH